VARRRLERSRPTPVDFLPMFRRLPKWSFVVLALWALRSGPSLAANLGIVHGTVHDESGHPIPAVEVTLFARQNVRVDSHVTDRQGHFEFEQVPFGRYRLSFAAPDGRLDEREVQIASGDVLEQDVTLPTLQETVTVVAPQREAARPAIVPASASHLEREDIQALPRGDSASVNEILATQPGFVYDALGQIYVRGNHANVQYQLDGVPLPDSVSGLFGEFLSPRLVENMEILTGGLPAEYGQRLSAVVNLNSRRPSPDGEGQAELRYGSFNTWTPSAFYGQKLGKVSFLTGGSFNWTDRGLDPPNPDVLVNDQSKQGRFFGKVDLDLGEHDHFTALVSYSHNFFEIPVDPTLIPGNTTPDKYGNPPPPYFPPDTRQTETENDLFGIASYRHDFGPESSARVAGYVRRSAAKFNGDPQHALGSTQVCLPPDPSDPTAAPDCPSTSNVNRQAIHAGLVADYLQRLGDQHALKFGVSVDQLWGSTAYDAYQRVDVPPPDLVRLGQGVDDATATSGGVYAQDRWTVGKLTLSGGLRFDFQTVSFTGTPRVTDVGVSPRLGASYAFTPNLVAHAFFGLLWTPPSVLEAPAAARLSGAVPPGQPVPYDLRPEKDRYAEVGIQARLSKAVAVGLNLWGKLATDQLDEVEIGNTTITSPYNFSEGRAAGIEATIDAVITQNLTAFGNVSLGTAQGKEIATAKYLFGPDDLANTDWQTLDHAQTWTANAGASYRDGPTQVSTLISYGSGLRTGANNESHVPGWVRVDLTLAHDFLNLPLRPTLAIDVVNLFDAQYAYRLYNGFNGSHWAPGRSVYLRGSVHF
jgi:outer membrane cobalamin receptor